VLREEREDVLEDLVRREAVFRSSQSMNSSKSVGDISWRRQKCLSSSLSRTKLSNVESDSVETWMLWYREKAGEDMIN
jgi:hypothetical protein